LIHFYKRLIFPRRVSEGGGGDVKGRLCRMV